MVGDLTPNEIESFLRANVIGRIGCHAYGRTYVVPITYAYDGAAVYAHSRRGMKLTMMRENPHVCFEVDAMDDFANWRSVIAWGTFAELRGSERERGLVFLADSIESRLGDVPPGESMHPRKGMDAATIYRILLEEKTGRFERRV